MKNSILSDGLVFSSSRNVLLGLSFVRNLIVARVLGPEEYGYWVVISLIMTYGDQIHLGLRHAGDKEIPYYLGQSNYSKTKLLSDTIYGGVIALSTIGFLILGAYSLGAASLSATLRYGLIMVGLIVVSDQINRFYFMILRTRKEFILSSKVEVLFELVRTLCVCVFVLLFQFSGAILAFLLTSLITSLFFIFRYKGNFFPILDALSLRHLFSIGIFLFLSGLVYILISSIDRIVASSLLSKTDLGVYGVAALVMQLPVNSSQGLHAVLYPRFSEQYGQNNDPRQLHSLYSKAMLVVSYAVPLLVAMVLFGGEFLIAWLLPTFKDSIPLMEYLSYGIFFLSLSPIPMGALMASGQNRKFLVGGIITLLLSTGIMIVSLQHFEKIIAVVISTDAMLCIFTTITAWHAFRSFSSDAIAAIKEMVDIYLPNVYGILMMIALFNIFPRVGHLSISYMFGYSILKFFIFCAVYSPFVIIVNRRTGILRNFRNMVMRRERND